MNTVLNLASDFDQTAKWGWENCTGELVTAIDIAFARAMQDDRFNWPVRSSWGESLNLTYDVSEGDLNVGEIEEAA